MITANVDLSRRDQGYFRTLANRLTAVRNMRYATEGIVTAARQGGVKFRVQSDHLYENGSEDGLLPGSEFLAARLERAGVTEVVVAQGSTVAEIERDLNALTDRSLPVADRILRRTKGGGIDLKNSTHKVPFTWSDLSREMGWKNLENLGGNLSDAITTGLDYDAYVSGVIFGGIFGGLLGHHYSESAQHLQNDQQGVGCLLGCLGGIVSGIAATRIIASLLKVSWAFSCYIARTISKPVSSLYHYLSLRSFSATESGAFLYTERVKAALRQVRHQFGELYLNSLSPEQRERYNAPSSRSFLTSPLSDDDNGDSGSTPQYPPSGPIR